MTSILCLAWQRHCARARPARTNKRKETLMHLSQTRPLILSLVLLMTATFAVAASAHKRNVNDNDTIPVYGNIHPLANAKNDRGPTDQNLEYEKMILVLKPRASRDTIDTLLAQLHDASSPMYHQWLTPAEFGARFGIADDDLSEVKAWL